MRGRVILTQTKHLRVLVDIKVDIVQPVVGTLDTVEDGGIVSVEHHAQRSYDGDVPGSQHSSACPFLVNGRHVLPIVPLL